MQPNEPFNTDVRAPMATHLTKRPYAARIHEYAPLLSLMVTSMFVLTGCEAIKGIFKVGAWFGALVVITIVAAVGGVAAIVMRRR
jgi:uncharacterized membrane protein YkvI